jgi:ubiquinone biosynthesis protein UbiJ
VTSLLETALNRYLRLDPDALARIGGLSDKVIALELVLASSAPISAESTDGLRFTMYLLPASDHIRVIDSYNGVPAVRIRGTPFALARQARGGERAAVNSGVEIEGDIQLGKAFQRLLTEVEIDWEEQLSQLLGDVAAHQLGNVVRGLQAWGRKTLDTLFKNTAEYLQEEGRDLPPSGAVAEFLEAVDILRSDIDRLEARIHRLRQASSGNLGLN